MFPKRSVMLSDVIETSLWVDLFVTSQIYHAPGASINTLSRTRQ
jgi:hypothetical protein